MRHILTSPCRRPGGGLPCPRGPLACADPGPQAPGTWSWPAGQADSPAWGNASEVGIRWAFKLSWCFLYNSPGKPVAVSKPQRAHRSAVKDLSLLDISHSLSSLKTSCCWVAMAAPGGRVSGAPGRTLSSGPLSFDGASGLLGETTRLEPARRWLVQRVASYGWPGNSFDGSTLQMSERRCHVLRHPLFSFILIT